MSSPELSIVDEQEKFLIVDKPAGMPVHQTANADELTMVHALREQENNDHLYPCHRLDSVTSGLIIVAKSVEANQQISQMFARRMIDKYYLAISDRKPSKKQGLVKGDMVPARNGCWKLLRTQNKPSITQFFSYGAGEGKRLFVLKPHTGKTHQLRVVMKSLGSPILGDSRYGGSGCDRCYLHAFELFFKLDGMSYHYRVAPSSGEFFQGRDAINRIASAGDLNWPSFSDHKRV